MSYITLVIKVISIIIVQFTIIYKATIIIITTIFVTPGDLMFWYYPAVLVSGKEFSSATRLQRIKTTDRQYLSAWIKF